MPDVIRPPWLPEGLYQTWLNHYIDAGGQAGGPGAETTAIEMTRQDPSYETYFPGIKRDDGTIRYAENPEQTYYQNIESFRNTVEGIGIRPDVFNEEYINLIEGDTSPGEFSTRVTALEDRVMSQGPGIRDWYAENFGLDMTNQGIMASLMSQRIDEAVLSRQITMAEIGGEGALRGFDISAEFANMLATDADMDRGEAQRLFGTARQVLPVLGVMARRHGDPDDSFDLMEFVEAAEMQDPEQIQRIERLTSQEQSLFSGGASNVQIARSRSVGGLAGLEVQ